MGIASNQSTTVFSGGTLIFPDQLSKADLVIRGGQIIDTIPSGSPPPDEANRIDVSGHFVGPGYIDIHVHGGAGGDFMDGTVDSFDRALRSHVRHGTTGILPTTTAARHDQILATLERTRELMSSIQHGYPRILGAHFYGPYFNREARGCHPADPVRPPTLSEYEDYLEFADIIRTATIAPEVEGTEEFAKTCRSHDIAVNVGHSHATFEQMIEAIEWGARHVDHLFCAMSDKSKLRSSQAYPMRGGVLEATLYFDQLTTEVIADGRHLASELLMLAYKIKGPDRLALVTDCNRALDMPDGEYTFGPLDGGELFVHRDNVGVMPDGSALASGATGMDHAVQTFRRLTDAPLPDVIRMATLTPARIAGVDSVVGSIEKNKAADLLVLDQNLNIAKTIVAGHEIT